MRTNYAQMLPYVSKDMREWPELYHDLEGAFQGMFDWMAEQVCAL